MATIKDVARLAQVSHTTVSHALSGKRAVPPTTRERVLAAARELDYRPNVNAQSLTGMRTRRVCLSIPLDARNRTLAQGTSVDIIAAVADRLLFHDYALVCEVSRGLDPVGLVNLVRAHHVDGMLLVGTEWIDPRFAVLREERIPFVALGRTQRPGPAVCVDADGAAATLEAARHLFGLGHRDIALVMPTRNGVPMLGFHWYARAGFRQAYHEQDIPMPRGRILAYDVDQGLHGVLPVLLDPKRAPSAVIAAGNDLEAATLLRHLVERGRRIPEDISLVGLVDSPLTRLARPAITVTDLPFTEACTTAVDLLMALIAGERPKRREHLLPVRLIVRDSTAHVSPVPATDLVATAH